MINIDATLTDVSNPWAGDRHRWPTTILLVDAKVSLSRFVAYGTSNTEGRSRNADNRYMQWDPDVS